MTSKTNKLSDYGYIKVAAVVPKLKVANPIFNASEIINETKKAYNAGARIITFPELSITGYTSGDLFHQNILLSDSILSLEKIVKETKDLQAMIVVGLPLVIDNMNFNVAAVINCGKIIGIVPKTSIPGYKEFYEERWFSSARDLNTKEIELLGYQIPVGTDLLFKNPNNSNCVVAIEICEDLWTPLPPSSFYAVAGAKIILNLSASNELVGKAKYRKELVSTQSSRNVCAYVYTSSGVHESTTDVVFGGHAIIAENGSIISESKRFEREGQIIYADIDLDFLQIDRIKTTSFGESIKSSNIKSFRNIEINIEDSPLETFTRQIIPNVFIPSDLKTKHESAEEIINIQVAGLVKRLEYSGLKKVILGLSGGLDSTLTLLVAKRAFELLNLPTQNIHCYTMPGLATSSRTKSNAWKLAEACNVSIEEIPINKGVEQHFMDIGHDSKTEDITYENTQARYRTMILMNKSNQIGGIVLGTGDLSEIALGWCTFSGDHLSHYNTNAGVPKTLVKHLVKHFGENCNDKNLEKILIDIVDTPISPELKTVKDEKIGQVTEDIIGPYELHDFFLYHFIRWGSNPKKILWQATKAFKNYNEDTIKKWLLVFITRFFKNQWKRSVMPDGPKVGSIALSPRGDWRMPSDAELNSWLEDLK